MANRSNRTESQDPAPVLQDEKDGAFYPLEVLWTTDLSTGRFKSEGAVRWFLRQNGAALVKARAIRLDCGRWIVNPERFASVRGEVSAARAEGRIAGVQA